MAERPTQSAEIRSAFLKFFADRGHHVEASSSLIPPNDPTLYFVNAGMVPFKNLFTGEETRSYTRAVSSQKCMRVSGKHNDLENVGPSPTHHTLFEMLGNFSFGDYSKREAIAFAWQFVTEVLQLPQERLLVTYLQGDETLQTDAEAKQLWKEVSGLPDDRILSCSAKDNFWRMGDTGPCGPCSEIFYFKGDNVDPARFDEPQAEDGSGWVEIWNLVFMQFEGQADGTLKSLPKPSVDTGMGLERVTSILQGKTSNYDTDLFAPLVAEVAKISGKSYTGTMSPDDVSMRVIADHSRSAAFLIADGVFPDRGGRAYVLRRVMRRAVRHGHRLGIAEPFLDQMVRKVIELLGEHYSELRERSEMIASIARQEEVRFRETIVRGLGLLDQSFARLEQDGVRQLPGAEAFKLYDTYGFPLDLTEVICAERGFGVDSAGYAAALEEARGKSEFKGASQAVEGVYREALAKVAGHSVQFVGYDRQSASSSVVALVSKGQLVQSAVTGDEVEVVTSQTPFYGESGGQVGDQGRIAWQGGWIEVTDTQKPLDGLVVHRGTVKQGGLTLGSAEASEVALTVDPARRAATARNHSATHLLHWALRSVVGPQAQQKGSVVGPDRLRFDFTAGQPLAEDVIERIEDLVNEAIASNSPVTTDVCSIEEAKKSGAMMIFEEKYGSTVRLLTMGPSVELCGGTHASATGEIGVFKILQEQGVAAGVRRITATTGQGVVQYMRQLEGTMRRAATAAKAGGGDIVEKIERLMAQNKALEAELLANQRRLLEGGSGGGISAMLAKAKTIGGVPVLGVKSQVTDRGALRELAEQLRDKLGDSVVLVASESDGKAQLVLVVAKPLTKKLAAGKLIRPIAEQVGGSGGGRPDMAQAGGTDLAQLDAAVELLYATVAQALG